MFGIVYRLDMVTFYKVPIANQQMNPLNLTYVPVYVRAVTNFAITELDLNVILL